MPLYVSDVLESLLDASSVRSAVRDHCVGLLASLDPALRRRLAPHAWYVGGKCMGYPAVWLLRQFFGPQAVSLDALIARAEPALSVSLTTTIVDDLFDGDETIPAEYVAVLYVLIAKSAFGARPHDADRLFERSLLDALEVCINPAGPDQPQRRGNRIGHFFRM